MLKCKGKYCKGAKKFGRKVRKGTRKFGKSLHTVKKRKVSKARRDFKRRRKNLMQATRPLLK